MRFSNKLGTAIMPALPNLEPPAAVALLLNVLTSAANGNDVSSVVPELQAVLSRSTTNNHVRKLAYEVCRHCNLTESEHRRLWENIRSDVNSSDTEVVAAALRFSSCTPPSELADRFVTGQLAEVLKPCLASEAAVVRAAAVQTLSTVLTLPEVQSAAAGSQGLANTYEGLWDELTDALLDERPFVVGLAASATAQLLEWGIPSGAAGFSGTTTTSPAAGSDIDGTSTAAARSVSLVGFMLTAVADRAAMRVSTALGPVLDMCGLVPAPGQVAVCDMLLALARRMLIQTLRVAAGGTALSPPPGVPVPDLSSMLPSLASYLGTLVQSGDAGARSEACGVVLALAADLAAAGPAAAGGAAAVPQALVLEAAQSLMQLREREWSEAGLADMCEAVAGALPALLPTARSQLLRQLWPLAGRIDDASRRARVLAAACRSMVLSELDYRTGSAPASGSTSSRSVVQAPPPLPANDPLSLLAAGLEASPVRATGIVTSVPAACRVTAQLEDVYLGQLLLGRAPAAEAQGAFGAAQAAVSASASPGGSVGSLLGSVTSMSRTAPPPPAPSPGSGPLTTPRVDSSRSAASVGPASLDGSKPSKHDKKSSVFGGLFGRNKSKGRVEVDSPSDSAVVGGAQEEVAAARQEAAAAQRAAAEVASPPSPAMSNGWGPGEGRQASPSVGAGAADVTRPPTHSTLRHELLQCLLQQLAAHPAAAVAAELCAEVAAAARHDRQPPNHSQPHALPGDVTSAAAAAAPAPGPARRLNLISQWLATATDVLSASAACVSWEPYVVPGITAMPSVSALGRVPADFNSLTYDIWLAVLMAALQAARSAQTVLGRLVAEAVEAATTATAVAPVQSAYGGMGYGMPYGMTPGGGVGAAGLQSEVTAESYYRTLLSYVKCKTEVLQGLVLRLLSEWASLSSSARPRVAWVAAHCLTLPGHWDSRWEALLACLEALLLRSTDTLAAARRHDLLGSALAGSLYKSGRQAWSDPSKPFLFDIASASALCEAPEQQTLGLLVGLAGLQHAAGRLLNAVAEAVPHGAAGAAHGQATAVARRVEAVVRQLLSTEVAATPHIRDWCKRILRSLATLVSFVPPTNLPVTVAALGLIAKQAHDADGTTNLNAEDDSSSDASSAYHPDEAPQELPPALAAAAAAMAAAAANASVPGQTPNQAGVQEPPTAAQPGVVVVNGGGAVASQDAAGGDGASRPKGVPGSSYLVHSAVTSVPMWGYPFAPLSSVSLHNSKRARRHRALLQHLTAAAAAAQAPRPTLRAAPPPPSAAPSVPSGPLLSNRTTYRLDREAFWAALPDTHSPWQELTGSADPVLLRGCYLRSGSRRADPVATITVMLSVTNRLAADISGMELSVRATGPLLLLSSSSWEVPKLSPQDRTAASFTLKVQGLGDMQLQMRLQLCPGPARTDSTPLQVNCLPLELPITLLLLPPRPLPEAGDFFKMWSALPARANLSGICTWPGSDGGALLLSALLRQPLACCWLQHLPALCSFQAAFTADTATDEPLALLVVAQLMPPVAPGGSPETFCSFSFRSSSNDLILSLQNAAAAWLTQLTAGTATLASTGRPGQPSPSTKPSLHPRVAALLQSYTASAAQLTSLTSMGSLNQPLEKGLHGGAAADSSSAVLRSAALLEWQRLGSMAV